MHRGVFSSWSQHFFLFCYFQKQEISLHFVEKYKQLGPYTQKSSTQSKVGPDLGGISPTKKDTFLCINYIILYNLLILHLNL